MAVGLQLGSIADEVGTSDFFYAFFSTISGNLEADGWGSRYPVLLNKLYRGKLTRVDAVAALNELEDITSELAKLPPNKVIWDIEHLEKRPPWKDNISPDISDLSNYFVTSTGRDLISVIREVIEELRDRGEVVKVVTI